MSPRSPQPVRFPSQAFSVSEALRHGVSRQRLRAKDLSAPFAGVRTTTAPSTVEGRCWAFAPRMPAGAVFSHSTAALLYGVPLPLELENARALHISVPGTRRSVDAAGIVGHEVHLPLTDAGLRAGLPLTTAARTWCDLGALLDFGDLVAAGDFLLRRAFPLTDRSSLTRAVDDYRSRRGIRNLRRALPLLSERSESRRESILRVILIEAGLPSLEVNHEVFDDKGNLVARVDLAHPARKIAIEYEGDHHRTDKRQWRVDVARVRRLNAIGWRVTRATADDIEVDPRELLDDLRIHFAETDD